MVLTDKPLTWEYYPDDPFVPITHEGAVVGFCRPEFAVQIVGVLNEEEKLRKALRIACVDIIRRTGNDMARVDELVSKYIARAERPRYGTRAIAALLRDRQHELDVSDQEFAKFCDSYRLSVKELKNIYAGEEIYDSTLGPLARILGTTVDELMTVRDGADGITGDYQDGAVKGRAH
jgi:hypothetical protein